VAEELEALGKSDFKAAQSQLLRLLMPLIGQNIQPGRDGAGWRASIVNARQ
jgi:hypothetical protein